MILFDPVLLTAHVGSGPGKRFQAWLSPESFLDDANDFARLFRGDLYLSVCPADGRLWTYHRYPSIEKIIEARMRQGQQPKRRKRRATR